VDAGLLQADGSVGDIIVAGGVLGGTGTVANITLDLGGIAPGGSPGTLTGSNLTWNGGGSFDFQLGSTAAASDLLALSGTLIRGGGSDFRFHFSDAGGAPQIGNTYTLLTFAGSSGFSASDFSFDYSGAAGTLNGHFVLNSNSLQFVTDAASQTITFANPGDQTLVQQTLSLSPVASSGLPVTLASSTPSVCTVTGSGPFTVNLVSAGSCTLTANQNGSATIAPAAPVTITFEVLAESIPMLSDRMLLLLGLLLAAIGASCLRFAQAGQ